MPWHAVAGVQGGRQDLFDIGDKAGAINRPIQDRRGGEVLGTQVDNGPAEMPLRGALPDGDGLTQAV